MTGVLIALIVIALVGLAAAVYWRRSNRATSISPAKARTDTRELDDLRRDFRNCFLREDQRQRYLRLYREKYPAEGEAEIIRRILHDHARDRR